MPDEKMAGHSDSDQRDAQTLPRLDVDEREGDGDARTTGQDVVQEAVARIAVVVLVPANSGLLKQVLAQSVHAVKRIGVLAHATRGGRGERVQDGELPFYVEPRVLYRGDQ